MAWKPFWQKNDNGDVDDNVNVSQNTAADATGTTDNAEGVGEKKGFDNPDGWTDQEEQDYLKWRNSLPDNLKNTDDSIYDMRGAYRAGLEPTMEDDGYYHLGSRDPKTGLILKSPEHPTYAQAIEADKRLGYEPVYDQKTGRMYTKKKDTPKPNEGDGEFTVSEEQLRDKGVDANGNFTVEPGMYDNIQNSKPESQKEAPVDADGTTTDGVDGNIDWNNTEEMGETGVNPLDVKPITPAISGDPNETAEEKDARKQARNLEHENEVMQQKINDFVDKNPYVLEDNIAGLYDKYKDKTPSEMIYNISRYREMAGLSPLTYEEKMLLLAGRDPNKSKKEVKAEKRRAKWADVLNELGNVMAHFYNYGRAKAGSPAATINHTPSNNAERLRAADMAMRQRGYNDYVNAMMDAEKRKQQRADYQEKLRTDLQHEKAKAEFAAYIKGYQIEHDPEMRKKYELLCEQGETQKAKTMAAKWDAEKKKAEALNIPKQQIAEKEKHEIDMELKRSQINKNNRGGKGDKGNNNNNNNKHYSLRNGEAYSDAYAAYQRGTIIWNKEHPNQQKKIVDSTKFKDNPNKYLDDVNVNY